MHTDHMPLTYLQSQTKLSRRNARWLDELAAFDVTFVHIPGRANVAADALSRIPAAPAAASVVAAALHCTSCGAAHIDEGWFATTNHTVHDCHCCGARFHSDVAVVGTAGAEASTGRTPDRPVPGRNEDIANLRRRVILQ